jgi:hypothetical protein
LAISTRIGTQVQDMRNAELYPAPGRPEQGLQNNLLRQVVEGVHEFVDPKENRVVRVVAFTRREPVKGERNVDRTPMTAGSYMARHHHNFDKTNLVLQMPLPDSGLDVTEPIGGEAEYQPEGTWYGPYVHRPRRQPEDHIEVRILLQHTGAEGEPFVTKEQLKAAWEKIEYPNAFRHDRGDYVAPDGTVQDGYEILCETALGSKLRYAPPRIGGPYFKFIMPVDAYPWYDVKEGVRIKPFAAFNANGPFMKLVKVRKGATIPRTMLENYRFVGVATGKIRFGGEVLGDLHALFATPGAEFSEIAAEETSLLWYVHWQPKDDPVAKFWMD